MHDHRINRRQALRQLGSGLGSIAFGVLAYGQKSSAHHFLPRAKSVIFITLNGGVSQVDTFDPKPMLDKFDGKPIPGEIPRTENRTGVLMKSPFSFRRYGESGLEISELFPHLGRCADRLCVIRSMWTDIPNHEPSLLMLNTGHTQVGRPSLGAWLTYGLGQESSNLPGFVVLCPKRPQTVGPPLYGSAFLPTAFQGTWVTNAVPKKSRDEDPKRRLPFLQGERTPSDMEKDLSLFQRLEDSFHQRQALPEHAFDSAVKTMETAFRMQTAAPVAFDLSRESEATKNLYGKGAMARGCLTARRLVERGVRVVQLQFGARDDWDDHDDILRHRPRAQECDQAMAGLLMDLESRGMLDETLVVCATEFGRTPVREVGSADSDGRLMNGRDHNPYGFSIWLAGGGVRGGMTYGATDDFGFRAVENPVHPHDLHATILHLMGLDHERLTFRYSGRDFRLTDVAGKVLTPILT